MSQEVDYERAYRYLCWTVIELLNLEDLRENYQRAKTAGEDGADGMIKKVDEMLLAARCRAYAELPDDITISTNETTLPINLDHGPGYYIRTTDPFHADMMPDGFEKHGNQGESRNGWMICDEWGNQLGFTPDGTIVV